MQAIEERVATSLAAQPEQRSGPFVYTAMGEAGFEIIDTLLTLDGAYVDPLVLIMLRTESFDAHWNHPELLGRSWECIERAAQKLSPKTTIRNLSLPHAIESLEVANLHRMQDIRESKGVSVDGSFLYAGTFTKGPDKALPNPSVQPMKPYYDLQVGHNIFQEVTSLVQAGKREEAYELAKRGTILASGEINDPREPGKTFRQDGVAYERALMLEQVVAPVGTAAFAAQKLVNQALDAMQKATETLNKIQEAKTALAIAGELVPDLHSLSFARDQLEPATERAIQAERNREETKALSEQRLRRQQERLEARRALVERGKAWVVYLYNRALYPDDNHDALFARARGMSSVDVYLRPPGNDPVETHRISVRNQLARGDYLDGLTELEKALQQSPYDSRYEEDIQEAMRVLDDETTPIPDWVRMIVRERLTGIQKQRQAKQREEMSVR